MSLAFAVMLARHDLRSRAGVDAVTLVTSRRESVQGSRARWKEPPGPGDGNLVAAEARTHRGRAITTRLGSPAFSSG